MKQVIKSGIFYFFLILMLVTNSSCTIRYVAKYDVTIKDEIIEVAKKVDLFWGQLLDTPIEERKYEKFKNKYNEIETDIRGLLMKNKIRPLNKESTKQSENALKLWLEDKAIHKDKDKFSDFEAKRHRKQFIRVFIAMAKGEEAKNISPDNQQQNK